LSEKPALRHPGRVLLRVQRVPGNVQNLPVTHSLATVSEDLSRVTDRPSPVPYPLTTMAQRPSRVAADRPR
jgi:hypothetical protein